MSFSWKLLQLAALAVAVCLPAEAARPPYPSPEDQIHRRLSTAREQAGSNPLERREELDGLARVRAVEIASRPAKKRLGGATPIGEILKEGGGHYRRALERLILFKNVDQVSGVMDKSKHGTGPRRTNWMPSVTERPMRTTAGSYSW